MKYRPGLLLSLFGWYRVVGRGVFKCSADTGFASNVILALPCQGSGGDCIELPPDRRSEYGHSDCYRRGEYDLPLCDVVSF